MLADDRTLTPRLILDKFVELYERVYERQPSVRYMGNHWYSVDGETVHRATIFAEIERLSELIRARAVDQLEETSAAPAIEAPIASPPKTGPLPAALSLPEPAYAAVGMPAAPINRGLIQRLIDRLRRL
ncbi:MAG: hypothetical protein NZM00_11425 [Anaerolinea sp.]|nr:hypothetical protein [Anaerolinea sp.]